MAYSAASIVAYSTPNLLGGESNFTATTRPSKAAVDYYLSAGCSIVESRLEAAGYSIPVSSTATIYGEIAELEATYGAARAEMAQLTARVSATERTRAQIFMDAFNKGLDALVKRDLSRAGLTPSTGKLYMGGWQKSDKDTYEADADRVAPRFARGQFDHPGANRPSGTGTNELTD